MAFRTHFGNISFQPLLIVLSTILGSRQNLSFNTKLHILSVCQHNHNPKIQMTSLLHVKVITNLMSFIFVCILTEQIIFLGLYLLGI